MGDTAMAIDLLIAPTLDTLLVVTLVAVAPMVPMDLMDHMAIVAILVSADCTRGRPRLSLRLHLKLMLRLESTTESPLTDTLLSPMDLGTEPLMAPGLEPAMDFLSVPVDTTTTTDMDFTRGLLMLMPSLVM